MSRLDREAQRARLQSDICERRATHIKIFSAALASLAAIFALPPAAVRVLSVPEAVRLAPLAGALFLVGPALFHSKLALALARVQFLLQQAQLPAVDLDTPAQAAGVLKS